ncbi:MAG: hypothetical protein U9Q78_06065 [Chloroflexota bacterium]|nr:hypothetical protein [Chloroflexota bacterium]
MPPVEAAIYVFSQLEEEAWVRADQLSLPLRIFCDEELSDEEICATGWRWGYLARQEVNGVTYYQPAEKETELDVDPEYYLYAPADQDLVVNLETIPYQELEYLARISDLLMADASGPCLAASPNLIKMGRVLKTIQEQPLTQWLRENAPAFRQALEAVEHRWSKQILHENLFIAQVNDLGLKVQLERAFPDPRKVAFLPNDYIAFPRRMLTEVETVVTQSGHVIRFMENDD